MRERLRTLGLLSSYSFLAFACGETDQLRGYAEQVPIEALDGSIWHGVPSEFRDARTRSGMRTVG